MPITEAASSTQSILDGEGITVVEAGLNNWVIASTDTGYRVMNVTYDGTTFTTTAVGDYNYGTTVNGVPLGGIKTTYDRDFKVISINNEQLFIDLNDTHLNVFALDATNGSMSLRSSTSINANTPSTGDNYNVSVLPAEDGTSIRIVWEEWDAGNTNTIRLDGAGQNPTPKTVLLAGSDVWAGDLVSVETSTGDTVHYHVGHKWGTGQFYTTRVPDETLLSPGTPVLQNVPGGPTHPYEIMSVRMPQTTGPDKTYFYATASGGLARYEINELGVITFLGITPVPTIAENSVSGDVFVDGDGNQFGVFSGGAVVRFLPNGNIEILSTGSFPNGTESSTMVLNGQIYIVTNTDGALKIYKTDVAAVEPRNPVCFCKGTLILTETGYVPIETLTVGDRVVVADGGTRNVVWLGRSQFDIIDLSYRKNLRPIRLRAGCLGDNVPEQDLYVSHQHRILLKSKHLIDALGADEFLVPANKLLPLDGVEICTEAKSVDYYHLLLESHSVIFANGTPTESLYLGPQALKNFSPQALAELQALGEAMSDANEAFPAPARQILDGGRCKAAIKQVLRHSGAAAHMG